MHLQSECPLEWRLRHWQPEWNDDVRAWQKGAWLLGFESELESSCVVLPSAGGELLLMGGGGQGLLLLLEGRARGSCSP